MIRNLLIAMMMMATAFAHSACAQTEYKIRLTFGAHTLTATLTDNSTTRAFVAKLPLTLPMMDLYGNEMCYRFDEALPTDSAYNQGYEVGDILYWPPRHSFVIRYAQNGEVFEMQKMGKVDAGVEIFEGIGDVDVTFELINLGDVNDDGTIDIADVSATIGYILDADEDINLTNADANQDGVIDIADVNTIISLIVSSNV